MGSSHEAFAPMSVTLLLEDEIDVSRGDLICAVDGAPELALNDISRVRLRTSKPLAFDPYARNRATGSFILITRPRTTPSARA